MSISSKSPASQAVVSRLAEQARRNHFVSGEIERSSTSLTEAIEKLFSDRNPIAGHTQRMISIKIYLR